MLLVNILEIFDLKLIIYTILDYNLFSFI